MPVNEKGEYEIGPEVDIRVNQDQVDILQAALKKLIRERYKYYFAEDGKPCRADIPDEEFKEITRVTWDILDLMCKLKMMCGEDETEAKIPC